MRVDFPGFVRVLAHFRPVDDEDEGNRDPKEPEPLNSRMNKLRCEFVSTPPPSETPELSHPRKDLGLNHALSRPIGDPPPRSSCKEENLGRPTSHFPSPLFPVAFQLYDLDRDGKISRLEMLQVGRPQGQETVTCDGGGGVVGDGGMVGGWVIRMIGVLDEKWEWVGLEGGLVGRWAGGLCVRGWK